MSDPTCSIDACDKPVFVKARGWCSAHYAKWRKFGDPLAKRYGLPPARCKAEDCDKPGNEGHGWCVKHYRRFWRHGDAAATSRIVGDDLARFESYIDKTGPVPAHRPNLGPCHVWTSALSPDGYAVLRIAGRNVYMARWIYEREHGELQPGHEPDHLCRVRRCVNVEHLESVTHRVNVLRGESFAAVNARKTHCPKGHKYTPENTRRQRGGGRLCRACQNDYKRLRR